MKPWKAPISDTKALKITRKCLFNKAFTVRDQEVVLEDVGYQIVENKETDASTEAEESEKVVNVHIFTNGNSISALEIYKLTLVTVIEFKSTKELVEYFKESNTLQGIVQDLEEDGSIEEIYNELKDEGFACGNCLIIPLGLDAETVLEAIDELNG